MLENNPINRIDQLGNVPVPTIAHYFWDGSNIPAHHLRNTLMFKQLNPDYEVNIWTSKYARALTTLSEMEISSQPADRYLSNTHGTSLAIRTTQELFDILSAHYGQTKIIESIFTRESNGPYSNPASGSDVIELAAVYSLGGVYMDTDVAVTGGIGTLEAPHGALARLEGQSTSNAVIASAPQSPIIKKLLDTVVTNYTTAPFMTDREEKINLGWSKKRSAPGEGLFSRFKLTMHMTGPEIFADQLRNVNPAEYSVPIEYFAQVDNKMSIHARPATRTL
ncbi:hypothetical protein AUC61_26225 [Pseudomonas sp. S25]|uniref:Glycosyltransferase sugar-binding region containing DXD motif-containing protein n=2 Tax=Pseudomonas maioricensis TaxID=1766623 RepID=A0ABS9ZS40_9PSED|nr:hypothetical protein [Pseudomonas sp. S25]